MLLTKPSFQIELITDLKLIERAGRTCYKTEDKIKRLQYKIRLEKIKVSEETRREDNIREEKKHIIYANIFNLDHI
jgi:hypothetical protein